jgi:hypothetical protein
MNEPEPARTGQRSGNTLSPQSQVPPVLGPARVVSPAWAVAVAIILVGLAMLFFFDPARHGFYPRCMFHEFTGLLCPGCGGLRAAHQLLHGHWSAAFAFNPLLCLFGLGAVGLGLASLYRRATGRCVRFRFQDPAWIWLLAGGTVLFAVARNLPAGVFLGLGP